MFSWQCFERFGSASSFWSIYILQHLVKINYEKSMIIIFILYHFFYLLQNMNAQEINPIFLEQKWTKLISPKYVMATKLVRLNQKQIEYLTDDNTNPKLEQFELTEQLQSIIKQLGGCIYAKAANRSAKDCSSLQNRIMNVKGLVMLIKLSQYLTEALCEQSPDSNIILRQYYDELQSGNDQFRVYVIKGKLVGICQKVTSFLGTSPTINQLSAMNSCKLQIEQSLFKQQKESFVIDVYCSPNGKDIKVMAIQPYHIHALSLFSEQELQNHLHANKSKPLVKIVEKQSELKDIDLSDYRPGSELKHLQNVKQWVDFMQNKNIRQQDSN